MSTPAIGTVRTIVAWVTGIVAFIVIVNIVEHLHPFRNDSPLNFALFIFEVMLAVRRGGPHWLDSFGADLRWEPPSIMPPLFQDTPAWADSSMPQRVSCRPEKNEDDLRCIV